MKQLPSTERGRRTRGTIVAAAARLMQERGLAAPTMDDVLAASNTGKSQLYHYFDSKRDLAVAVLHHQFERVMAAQPSLRDLTCTDLEQWRDEVLRAHRESGLGTCPLGVFVGQVDQDLELQTTLAELFSRWQDAIAELVRRALGADRVLPGVDPAAAGRALLTALQGGIMLAHLHREPETLVQAVDHVINGLVGPTHAPPSPSPA